MDRQAKNKHRNHLSVTQILVVFFVIAVVAVVVLTALNPNDRMADARDAQRIEDMHTLITAVHQFMVDTNGSFPEGVTAGMPSTQLGTCEFGGNDFCAGAQEQCVDVSASVTSYIDYFPVDPLLDQTSMEYTGYSISTSEDGVVTITACGAETSELSVSR